MNWTLADICRLGRELHFLRCTFAAFDVACFSPLDNPRSQRADCTTCCTANVGMFGPILEVKRFCSLWLISRDMGGGTRSYLSLLSLFPPPMASFFLPLPPSRFFFFLILIIIIIIIRSAFPPPPMLFSASRGLLLVDHRHDHGGLLQTEVQKFLGQGAGAPGPNGEGDPSPSLFGAGHGDRIKKINSVTVYIYIYID